MKKTFEKDVEIMYIRGAVCQPVAKVNRGLLFNNFNIQCTLEQKTPFGY